ncbi:hypothetical protein DB346_23005 [Verrucomicrobia bacterium LW23]|nr:hypothetical protein DB346_23005 [Verrucomicrobia bacterium LW23]
MPALARSLRPLGALDTRGMVEDIARHIRAYPRFGFDQHLVGKLAHGSQLAAHAGRYANKLLFGTTATHPQRVDYEYEQPGTASIFLFCEPLTGWRQVTVRDRRTRADWAQEVEHLLRTRYPDAEKVLLVCDNLNTHTKGAFYEVYLPEKARKLVRPEAIAHNLPIGSGLIESGHKHLFHARLKIPGAAWLPNNADHIAQLRVLTANLAWEQLWNSPKPPSPLHNPSS